MKMRAVQITNRTIELNLARGLLSRDIELIPAKVPLLKFFYKDSPVDLSVNTDKGVRNTHLLFCYGQSDWRVRPLVSLNFKGEG